MEWYPWLNSAYFQILESYREGRGHHFLLLHSKRNNGESSLVYALSRWLMCSQPLETKSCNQCASCHLMQSSTHPDYYFIQPNKDVKSIGIEQIRTLIEKLYQYAYVAKLKIVYIENSNWLTLEAVNALLKIFEEPPSRVYFFLGCRNLKYMLSTLLSRCLCWTIPPPGEQISIAWLHKKGIMNNMQALIGLRLSDGFPLDAYYILRPDFWKLRLELCTILWKVINKNNFLSMLSFFKNNENSNKFFISWLCSLLIDAMKWHAGVCDSLINMDQVDLVRAISVKYSALMLNIQLQQWLICLYYWENISHINKKLLLIYQLLNIEGNVMNFSCY